MTRPDAKPSPRIRPVLMLHRSTESRGVGLAEVPRDPEITGVLELRLQLSGRPHEDLVRRALRYALCGKSRQRCRRPRCARPGSSAGERVGARVGGGGCGRISDQCDVRRPRDDLRVRVVAIGRGRCRRLGRDPGTEQTRSPRPRARRPASRQGWSASER